LRGLEIFDHARDAGAKLLSVERLPAVGGDEQLAAAFLLVFDAGRVLVAAETATRSLCALYSEDKEDAPSGMLLSLEDEPWWRVLGCRLSGVWSQADGAVLRIELQTDGAAPRFITLSVEGEAVRSALAQASGQAEN
jgi:hypothetical protein